MRKICLFLILFLAVFFRTYHLNSVPPSLSLDEVSLGWNAYSILQTGADEYGTKFPILLRAYDDWRPALYVYLVIPFVKLFGLSALSVRLSSVLLSLMTIMATYFLVKELFRNSLCAVCCALCASFLLAISPWHIYISRLGHEVNAGLTFGVLGIFFFIKAVNSGKKTLLFLVFSAIFWSLSFYTYQSLKIFGPAMIVTLALIYRRKLLEFKRETVLAALAGLILIIPIIRASLNPEAMIRFKATSILNNQAGSRTVGLTVGRAYFSHFNPTWLFLNDGEEKHKIPGLGIFYLWELPLLLIGAYKLAVGNFPKQTKFLLLGWILIAPLPASIATEAPHAMRIFNLLPAPQIISAVGLTSLISGLKSRLWLAPVILIILASTIYLYYNYFIVFPREQSGSFQYPLSQAIPYVLENQNRYEKIVFSNKDNLYQSYMFFLFYSRYDPKLYQLQGGTISGGFAENHKFGKYEFRPINWGKEDKVNSLFIGNINDFPSGVSSKIVFKSLDNQGSILIYDQD